MNRRPPHTIYVNDQPCEVLPRLEYGQLIKLAFGVDDGRDYRVRWSMGDATTMTLKRDDGVVITVKDGMSFEVTAP